MSIYLSDDESEALKDILEQHSAKAGRELTVEKLIGQWADFIAEVEGCYCRTIYDYINDLATREILEQIYCNAPSSVQKKLNDALDPWDSRFFESTEKAAKSFDRNAAEQDQPWWFRRPKELCPELEADLRSEGFLF